MPLFFVCFCCSCYCLVDWCFLGGYGGAVNSLVSSCISSLFRLYKESQEKLDECGIYPSAGAFKRCQQAQHLLDPTTVTKTPLKIPIPAHSWNYLSQKWVLLRRLWKPGLRNIQWFSVGLPEWLGLQKPAYFWGCCFCADYLGRAQSTWTISLHQPKDRIQIHSYMIGRNTEALGLFYSLL